MFASTPEESDKISDTYREKNTRNSHIFTYEYVLNTHTVLVCPIECSNLSEKILFFLQFLIISNTEWKKFKRKFF